MKLYLTSGITFRDRLREFKKSNDRLRRHRETLQRQVQEELFLSNSVFVKAPTRASTPAAFDGSRSVSLPVRHSTGGSTGDGVGRHFKRRRGRGNLDDDDIDITTLPMKIQIVIQGIICMYIW